MKIFINIVLIHKIECFMHIHIVLFSLENLKHPLMCNYLSFHQRMDCKLSVRKEREICYSSALVIDVASRQGMYVPVESSARIYMQTHFHTRTRARVRCGSLKIHTHIFCVIRRCRTHSSIIQHIDERRKTRSSDMYVYVCHGM